MTTHKQILSANLATKSDLHALMLNNLVSIDTLYKAIQKERDRQLRLCVNAGITKSRIRETIQSNK